MVLVAQRDAIKPFEKIADSQSPAQATFESVSPVVHL